MPRTYRTEEIPRLSPEEYKEAGKVPLCIVLDNIRSQHNIGSVFRTADIFRSNQLILCGISATPPQREIHKAALGATETVAWAYYNETAEAIEVLRSEGYRIAALERAEGSIEIGALSIADNEKWAVIIGNEVHGISQQIMDRVDLCIEIPQAGTKHSLNVSVASAILQWEFFKRYRAQI